MTRIDIINKLIEKFGYQTYLEIGVNQGDCIRNIKAPVKYGVDPHKLCDEVTHEMTSDEFFAQNNNKFDLIFIDGYHVCEQVTKDFHNSIKFLAKDGCIVMHDCNPHSEYLQTIPPTCSEWTGDVWRAVVLINSDYGYESYVVDTDYGVGVFFPYSNKKRSFEVVGDLSWDWLVKNRDKALNIISIEHFNRINSING